MEVPKHESDLSVGDTRLVVGYILTLALAPHIVAEGIQYFFVYLAKRCRNVQHCNSIAAT